MGTVTVYRFEVYDISTDEYVTSRRWGIREAIQAISGARALEKSAAIFDDTVVTESDIPGLSKKDHVLSFEPTAVVDGEYELLGYINLPYAGESWVDITIPVTGSVKYMNFYETVDHLGEGKPTLIASDWTQEELNSLPAFKKI